MTDFPIDRPADFLVNLALFVGGVLTLAALILAG